MIIREHYLQPIRDFYNSDLIKIITGIRRCGKSVILQQIMAEILKITDNIIYLNFEDKYTSFNITSQADLLQYISSQRKSGKCYIFLDEVQVIDGWQEACKTLRLYDNSVFITGSNSKLLSKEFTKELSGRYIAFRIRPFVYKEILQYCKTINKEVDITDYLIWGGFPQRFEFQSPESQKRYLSDLDDTIVLNDLMNRYKIRKTTDFRAITNFILRSNSRIFSAKSIHDYLKTAGHTCSVNTVMKYLSYLEEAYIIESINQYSLKTKKELAFYKKIYNADVAFNSLRSTSNHYDLTHNLENIVYNELLYMGYKLSVFNDNSKEIDFLAQKDNKKYFIQVAYSVAEEKTYNREFAPFKNIDNLSKKILITTDELDYSTSTVQHIKLKDFLRLENLE